MRQMMPLASVMTGVAGVGLLVVGLMGGTALSQGPQAGTGLALPAVTPAVLAATETAPATTQAAKEYAATDTEALKKAAQASESAIVSGTVDKCEASASGRVAKITFQGVTGTNAFTAIFFPKQFEAMEKAFGGKNGADLAGKKIKVSGTMQDYKGTPEIVINSPDQVQIVK